MESVNRLVQSLSIYSKLHTVLELDTVFAFDYYQLNKDQLTRKTYKKVSLTKKKFW